MIGLLFVVLAADVRFEQVAALGWAGFGVVATLVLVVRPIGVWLCTLGSDLDWRERLFVAWVAPRGIVAAAIASLVAVELEAAGLAGGVELRALVFLTIAVTVALAGLTAGSIGSLLGVRLRERDTVAILGTGTLGLALANELRAGGVPVVLLDSNPEGVRRAQEAGFTVVFGNALNESVMQRARFGLVRTVVSLTANRTLNGVFVERARSRFGVPNGLVAVSELGVGIVSEQVERGEAKIVFDGPHDVERWDVRGRRGDVAIEHFVFSPSGGAEEESEVASPGLDERSVVLSVERGGRTFVMDRQWKFQAGDRAAIALHRPEREEAIRALAERGWHLATDSGKEPDPDDDGAKASRPADSARPDSNEEEKDA